MINKYCETGHCYTYGSYAHTFTINNSTIVFGLQQPQTSFTFSAVSYSLPQLDTKGNENSNLLKDFLPAFVIIQCYVHSGYLLPSI